MPGPELPRRIRFGEFEADLVSGELHKDGLLEKILLQDQPLQILRVLVARSGEMVSREELTQLLWKGNTNVDFDPSLNKAINRLRESLGDSAEDAHYIETLSRRGYRLIPRLELLDAAKPPAVQTWTTWKSIGAGCVAIVILIAGIATVRWTRTRRTPTMRQTILTANPPDNPVINAYLSADGKYLAYGEASGVVVRTVETGENRLLDGTQGDQVQGWFPAGDRLLLRTDIYPREADLLSLSLLTGVKRKLAEHTGGAAVSPDGSHIAVIHLQPSEVLLMGPSGEDPRRVVGGKPNGRFLNVTWAPGGKRIAYEWSQFDAEGPAESIESSDVESGASSTILPHGYLLNHINSGLCWLRDGRLVFSKYEDPPNLDDGNIWAVLVDPISGTARGDPARLTHSAGISLDTLSASSDGKRLSYRFGDEYAHVYVAELEEQGRRMGTPRPLVSDHWFNFPADWAPDSKSVLVVSERRGRGWILRRSLSDSRPEEVATNLPEATEAEFSPDGEWVLYWSNTGRVSRILRMPVAGGAPLEVLSFPKGIVANFRCVSAGKKCVLAEFKIVNGKDSAVFSSLDPMHGNLQLLSAVPLWSRGFEWMLSPDGTNIAAVDESSKIRIVRLASGVSSTLAVEPQTKLWHVCWAADGKSLVVTDVGSAKFKMIRVDLSGKTGVLLEGAGYVRFGRISPDGRLIAFMRLVHEGNAAILEDF